VPARHAAHRPSTVTLAERGAKPAERDASIARVTGTRASRSSTVPQRSQTV
jgi:hypothetical protein